MGHPLTPDLSKLNIEELNNKYGELLKRVTFAYRTGNPEVVRQLQMLLEDYQNEIRARNAKSLEEMSKHSKQFKNLIDIQ